jgi:hypothetical protein
MKAKKYPGTIVLAILVATAVTLMGCGSFATQPASQVESATAPAVAAQATAAESAGTPEATPQTEGATSFTSEPATQSESTNTPAPASSGETAGKLDACALVRKTDVEAVLGAPVMEPTYGMQNAGSETMATISECVFEATDLGKPRASVLVRRSPVNSNSPAELASVHATVKEMARSEPQPVAGIGDTAFWGGQLAGLHVFKGNNWYVIISVSGLDDDAVALDKAKTLAQQVLDQLGA